MATPTSQPGYINNLRDIVHDGVATVSDLAEAGGCSKQHIRNVLNPCSKKGMSLEVFQSISAWLVDECGEFRQLEGFLGVNGGAYLRPDQVEIDLCLKEEMADIQKEITYADDAMKDGEIAAARRHGAKIKGLAQLAMEEIEAAQEMHESRGDGHICLDRDRTTLDTDR